jgi:hypothetical protein
MQISITDGAILKSAPHVLRIRLKGTHRGPALLAPEDVTSSYDRIFLLRSACLHFDCCSAVVCSVFKFVLSSVCFIPGAAEEPDGFQNEVT